MKNSLKILPVLALLFFAWPAAAAEIDPPACWPASGVNHNAFGQAGRQKLNFPVINYPSAYVLTGIKVYGMKVGSPTDNVVVSVYEGDPPTGNIGVYRGSRMLIEFHTDGNIGLYGPTWSKKASEGDVYNAVLGWSWRSMDHKLWVKTQGGWHPMVNGEMNVFKPTVEHKLTHIGDRKRMSQYTVTDVPTAINPVTVVKHIINKEGKREVMRKFKPFAEYTESMLKLRGVEVEDTKPFRTMAVSDEELCNTFGFTEYKRYDGTKVQNPTVPFDLRWGLHNMKHPHAEQMVEWMLSSDPTDQYKAFLLTFRHLYLGDLSEMMSALRRTLTRAVMMHYHKQCLTKVTADPGELARDRYRWAIPA